MENQILDENVSFADKPDRNVEYAGFWIRVGATIFDIFVYIPLIALNFYFLYFLKTLPGVLLVNTLLIAYKPFMEYRYGATVGKMAVKIKVVNKELGNISLNQALIRYSPWLVNQAISMVATIVLFQHPDFGAAEGFWEVGALLSEGSLQAVNSIVSLFTLISCIAVGLDAKKQAIHDRMAGTYCIYT